MRRKMLSAAAAAGVLALSLTACIQQGGDGPTTDWSAEAGKLELVSAEVEGEAPDDVVDGTKYVVTVHLKEGTEWSDGTPLTAGDYVGLFNVMWAQQYGVWNSILDVVAVSDTELQFQLADLSPNIMLQLVRWNQPGSTSQFGDIYDQLAELRSSGVPSSDPAVAAVVEELNALEFDDVLGYGPYVVDPATITAQQLSMVKNDAGLNADEIDFSSVEVSWGQTEQTLPLLLENQLDYTTDAYTPSDVKALQAIDNIELIRTPLSVGTGIWFNETIAPFDDVRFRQAIAFLIDRGRNATVSLGDAAKPVQFMAGFSDNYVGDWLTPEVAKTLVAYDLDLEKAAELLEDVGLEKDGDSWTYDGQPFGFEITAPTGFPDFLASAQDVSAQLNEFGFDTQVRGIPNESRPDTIAQGRYEVMLDFSMVSSPPHPQAALNWNMARGNFGTNDPEAGTGLNWPWEQTAADGSEVYIPDLLAEAVDGLDPEPQKAAVETLAQIFNEQLPVIPIFERYTTDPVAHGPRVTGWLPADHPIYENNQGNNPYSSIQFLEGVLRPVEGSDGTFRTSAPYSQPPGYTLNYYNNSIYLSMTSPSYDLAFPPLFYYANSIQDYIPTVGETYSIVEID